MNQINLVLPNQLFKNSPLFTNNFPFYLVEEYLFFKQYPFHKQKIAFHRATMKRYANFIQEEMNLDVHYIESIDFDYDSSPRIVIFKSSLSFIKDKPLFGWGASTFPHLQSQSLSKVDAQHTQNIFLELAHNFGIHLSIIIF